MILRFLLLGRVNAARQVSHTSASVLKVKLGEKVVAALRPSRRGKIARRFRVGE